MKNTKARHAELMAAAAAILTEQSVDVTRQVAIRPLAHLLADRDGCHYETAKRVIARAIRLRRGELPGEWGGKREGAGRPPTPKN